jgi:protein-tyrosine phosphatase
VDGDPAHFSVLAVCTGNVCRSPAVQALLRQALAPHGVTVSSAGTRALVGAPVEPAMASLVRAMGAETAGIVARQLTPAMVAEADLVLALTREHRSAVVTLDPRALRRTFTLREFAELVRNSRDALEADDVSLGVSDRLGAAVRLAAAARGGRRPAAGDDDLPDPYGREAAVYASVTDAIASAVTTVLSAVAPARV